MKTKKTRQITLALTVFWLAGSFSGCTGWSEDGLPGAVTLYRSIEVKGSSGRVELENGAAKLHFDYGIYGMKDPSFTLKYASGRSVSVSVPRKAFSGTSLNASAEDLQQDFGLRGRKMQRVLSEWQATGSEGCSFCGYCSSLQTTTDSQGHLTTTFGFGYSCTCGGSHTVTRRYQKVSERLVVDLLDRDRRVSGRFVESQQRVSTRDAGVVSEDSCG